MRKWRLQFPDQPALEQLQENLQTINEFRSAGAGFARLLAQVQETYRPIQKLERLRKIDLGSVKAPEITQAAEAAQKLRNALVHRTPVSNSPRPAYRLDEDGDGHD